jgi:hypothetical protein
MEAHMTAVAPTLTPGTHRAPWSTPDGLDVLVAIGVPHPITGKPTFLHWALVTPGCAESERVGRADCRMAIRHALRKAG